jgi:protein-tyrosine phosphatase
MIDIHCHILPSIDDGPSEIKESVEMAKVAAADGIRTIVASPHFLYGEKPGFDEIKRAISSLRKTLKEGAVPVEVVEGADVKLTYELLEGMRKGEMPTINGSRYFLLELPEIVPPNLDNFMQAARACGFVPIITHPERNYSFLSAPRKMDGLREAGALLQVTAMSITGDFGMKIRRFSQALFKKGLVDFVATDAHGAVYRRPVLSEACKVLSHAMDRNRIGRIFFENPEAVLADREIVID